MRLLRPLGPDLPVDVDTVYSILLSQSTNILFEQSTNIMHLYQYNTHAGVPDALQALKAIVLFQIKVLVCIKGEYTNMAPFLFFSFLFPGVPDVVQAVGE
jgi:hypothetical protein